MQYGVFPYLSVNEADEYSLGGGRHLCAAALQKMFVCTGAAVATLARGPCCRVTSGDPSANDANVPPRGFCFGL